MSGGEQGTGPRVVVVGAGQAGATLALGLRRHGHRGPVTLLGEEPDPPYERPPLSKAYLAGRVGEDHVLLAPARSAYDDAGVALRLGDPVVALDRASRVVRTASGREEPYDALVLAVGARPRRLALPGADLDGVLVLRTLADARDLRRRLATARDVVVVGAGFVGMEVAAVAAQLGRPATVLEALDRPHARLVTPEVSAAVAVEHARRGTRVVTGASVRAFAGDSGGRVRAVVTGSRELPADLVVVGVGVLPRTEPAEAAGLAVEPGPPGGIRVDAHLTTSDPRVSAVGDCAAYPSPTTGARVRIESVQNAADQAEAVAARLVGGTAPYTAVPWFWSDQFDLHLQIAGLAEGYDDLLLVGDRPAGEFSVLCFRDDRLVAVESVSRPADHLAARKLLSAGVRIDRRTAAAPGFDLKAHHAAWRRSAARTS